MFGRFREPMFGRYRSFKRRRSRRRRRGGHFCIAACFTVAIYPWFYGKLKQISSLICIIILIISTHALPWFITPWEEQITSGDVVCSQSRQFNSVERTITSFLVGLELRSRLGRKSWVAATRVACAKAHYVVSKFYASKLYQRKAK